MQSTPVRVFDLETIEHIPATPVKLSASVLIRNENSWEAEHVAGNHDPTQGSHVTMHHLKKVLLRARILRLLVGTSASIKLTQKLVKE